MSTSRPTSSPAWFSTGAPIRPTSEMMFCRTWREVISRCETPPNRCEAAPSPLRERGPDSRPLKKCRSDTATSWSAGQAGWSSPGRPASVEGIGTGSIWRPGPWWWPRPPWWYCRDHRARPHLLQSAAISGPSARDVQASRAWAEGLLYTSLTYRRQRPGPPPSRRARIVAERARSAHRAPVPQAGDVGGAEPEPGEHVVGVGAGAGRRRRRAAGGAAEAGRGRRLGHPAHVDERLAGRVVRVGGRIPRADHRGHARVRAREHLHPFRLGAPGEGLGQPRPQLRPAGAVVLGG